MNRRGFLKGIAVVAGMAVLPEINANQKPVIIGIDKSAGNDGSNYWINSEDGGLFRRQTNKWVRVGEGPLKAQWFGAVPD